MSDLCRLMWCGLIGLFRSRAALEAEILVLRHQLNVLRRKSPRPLQPLQRCLAPPSATRPQREQVLSTMQRTTCLHLSWFVSLHDTCWLPEPGRQPAPESTARILSPASGGLNCTKGKVGPYVSVGGQQHRRHGPCCGRIDGAWSATNAPSFLRHGLLDRFDQLTALKGLAQKGNATALERLLARGLVIEGGHEDDRKHGSGTLEPPPQFNTRHPAEMDVQEETIDLSYCSTIEEFLRRCKDHGRKALCVQQALGGIERAGIVIHDCHDCPTLQHETPRLPSDRKTKSGAIFDRMRTYDRIDARRDLSLGAVHLDTALVGPRKAFAKCNRR